MSDKPVQLEDIAAVGNDFATACAQAEQNLSESSVEQLRVQFLGRKGHITSLMESLRNVSKEDRPVFGKAINDLRQKVESTIESLKSRAKDESLNRSLSDAPLDVTLPAGAQRTNGSLHPVTLIKHELMEIFRRLGFTFVDGPELDLDFYNFSALNFKDDHPARDTQDTFFVRDFGNCLMRTQTSNVQIHAMLDYRPPLRVISLGRTYRCDYDATHTPMFHQIEGFIVDRNITMGDMKGVLNRFLNELYGGQKEMRLRPSYFPFVEPGAEFDVLLSRTTNAEGKVEEKWLELGGLGMIHPNVLEAVGIDSETYTGFAFGFGIDRMAMTKYAVPDLRLMFEGNQGFVNQYPVYPQQPQ